MITSGANSKVKQVIQWQNKAKERKKDKVFLAEGMKMFEEAPTDWICEVYLSETMAAEILSDPAPPQLVSLQAKLLETSYETVKDDIFVRMSDTQTPQGILTVLKQPVYRIEELLQCPNPLFLIIENLQDPGNLGTIIRTGEGAGITGVFLSSKTVDIFNPKTIRATMGSVYRVPFTYVTDLSEIVERLRRNKVHIYAAQPLGAQSYDSFSYCGPTAFLIGNESRGLTEEISDSADSCLKIPMEGRVESLNAAVSAALLMYEAHRQRTRNK
ncbi:MAG: RNA methyltransferase [Lachnoclostridium sp.]|nr:RNA methyltransferase [Lachnospira sp.]MCM1248640.1 RNA methyltransferase [Lachnoclostridium sp.]MCM1535941.1 RNA methyltransferase [Clostridium sp.]